MSAHIRQRKVAHSARLSSRFDQMRGEKVMTNFIVKVGETSFPVHRTVLAASTDYFLAMLTHDTKEVQDGIVVMKDVSADAVKQCIDFMYTGEFLVNMETVCPIVYVSTLMQLDDVTDPCIDFIKENMTSQNCLQFRTMAQAYSRKDLLEYCEDIAIDNFSDIIGTAGFEDLTESDLIDFVEQSEAQHEVIWQSLTTWIGEDSGKKELLPRLMENLLTEDFPMNYLVTTAWAAKVVQDSPAAKTVLIKKMFSNSDALKNYINLDTWFSLKRIADTVEDSSRVEAVTGFINDYLVNNFMEVVKRDEYKALAKQDFVQIFKASDPGYFHKCVKWEALIKWVKHDRSREKVFPDLFKCIKLKHLSTDFIYQVISQEPLVKKSHRCKDLIIDALGQTFSREMIAILDEGKREILACDPSDNKCFTLVDIEPGDEFTGIVSLNGKLYLMRDRALLRLEDGGTWSALQEIGELPARDAKIVEFRNKIHVLDERNMWVYNPNSDLWVHYNHDFYVGAVAADSDFIYASDGDETVRYNQVSESLSYMRSSKFYHKLGAASVLENKLHLLGGCDGSTGNVVEYFDSASDSWEKIASMRHKRDSFSCCVLNDSLYAVGGARHQPPGKDSIEVYDRDSNEWNIVCQMDAMAGPVQACVIVLPN